MTISGHQKRHGRSPILIGIGRKRKSASVNGSENASVTKLMEKFPKYAVSFFSYTRRIARKSALPTANESHMSGRRESDSVYLLPKQAYYRYTTPREECILAWILKDILSDILSFIDCPLVLAQKDGSGPFWSRSSL